MDRLAKMTRELDGLCLPEEGKLKTITHCTVCRRPIWDDGSAQPVCEDCENEIQESRGYSRDME